jgi:hypothetical protein
MIKKIKNPYLVLSVSFLFIGMLFFLIQRNWLVVKWVGLWGQEKMTAERKKDIAARKKIDIFFWKDEKFQKETLSSVWFRNGAENIKHLINNWLVLLYEERVIQKSVRAETVALTDDGTSAIVSFEASFLGREWSTKKKSNTIESLFKTIRAGKSSIQKIIFLVKQHSMEDDQFDFSQPWPCDGFLDLP